MDILLIDDEVSLRRTLRTTLESMGHTAAEASSGDQTLRLLQKQRFDAAFLDLRLGREAGLDLLPSLLREAPDLAVVVVTAYATIASAVEAMRRGAFDYLPKPFTPDQLRVTLERWRQMRRLRNQVADLQEQVRAATPDADLETVEPAMRQALDLAFQAAASEATVLLRGESGTGKGVLARAMHSRSPRAGGPFVTVHCPSLSAELLESELFGHVKGAFTGAFLDTTGKAAAAEGGTLFLDEIGDLPLSVQPKLLRLVQDKAYERVGDTKTRVVDIRILTATNRDLKREVETGKFREDLYYRLNVIEVELPPLRRRPPSPVSSRPARPSRVRPSPRPPAATVRPDAPGGASPGRGESRNKSGLPCRISPSRRAGCAGRPSEEGIALNREIAPVLVHDRRAERGGPGDQDQAGHRFHRHEQPERALRRVVAEAERRVGQGREVEVV